MKEFFTSVRHQTAVRLLGTRNLYLRTVYCHVLGYTQAPGSWQGTHLEMAHQLELSKSQITRCLNTSKAPPRTSLSVPSASCAVHRGPQAVRREPKAMSLAPPPVQTALPLTTPYIQTL